MDSPDRWEQVGQYLQIVAGKLLSRSAERYDYSSAEPPTWEGLVRYYFEEEAKSRTETDRVIREFVATKREVLDSLSPASRYYLLLRMQCAHDFLGMAYPPDSDQSPFGAPGQDFTDRELIKWLLMDLWYRRFDHWLKLTAIGIRGPFAFYGIEPASDEPQVDPALVHQFGSLFKERWQTKTLAQFRDEALLEDNGTVFESMRAADGPRVVLIICVTNPEQIEIVERAMASWTKVARVKCVSYELDRSQKRCADMAGSPSIEAAPRERDPRLAAFFGPPDFQGALPEHGH
jgi:hypothetical protein